MRRSLVLTAIFSLLSCSLNAQSRDQRQGNQQLLFGELGLGAVTTSTAAGIGALLEVTYAQNDISLSLKGQGGGTINIFGNNESIGWLSLSPGYQIVSGRQRVRIAAGPAYYSHSYDTTSLFSGASGHRSENAYGVNAEVDGVLTHTKYFGLGLSLSALLAHSKVFFGLTLDLLVGKLE